MKKQVKKLRLVKETLLIVAIGGLSDPPGDGPVDDPAVGEPVPDPGHPTHPGGPATTV
jgi:hypothetical protein